MANKLYKRPKNIKERRYDSSLSKHNDKFGTQYILFDPKNITSFECFKGMDGEKILYIKERLACMWGNEEIEEYVVVDDEAKTVFEDLCKEQVARVENKEIEQTQQESDKSKGKKIEFVKARVDDVIVYYTHKAGLFSRFHYNVWFEFNDNYYYLYIKTCDGAKFKALMEEFLTYKKII